MDTEKLSQDDLETLLKDLRWESEWRAEADRASDYYDGNQLTSTVLSQMKDRNLAPLIRNLIGPTVDLVLGIEAKAKRDWKIVADQEDAVDTADALSAKMKQAERLSQADRACSDAYASEIKTGIGWCEVAREANPFRSPYRVNAVHRREIFWDFRAKEPDLADARYLVRKRWMDEDIVLLHFPDKAKLIKKAMSRWADWDEVSTTEPILDLARSYDVELRSSLEEAEWRDVDRKRVCLYEVWYRHWQAKPVMVMPSGQVMELDERNPAHLQAVALGMVRVQKAVFPKVRLAWWAGPHLLADVPSPYLHGYFPYVPFWGYREDNTGVPYGMIRRMMSPQDEINARLAKMMWLLSGKRIIADSDAVDMTWAEVAEEAARPDAVILMNPNRKNKNADALRIETDFQLSQQQFSVLQDATKAIQDAAGVYQSMLGKSEYSGQSGTAISNLVEQGSTTLAEINDNYRFARRQVGVLLLSLVLEDIGSDPHSVVIQGNGTRRTVVLNEQTQDEHGFIYKTNDVVNTQMRVELEDVPDTPSYRAQQFQMMVELAKSMPPELQPLLADFMIRASDLPFRHEVADRITKALGLDQQQDPNAPPQQDPAAMQEQALMQMQQQEMQLKLEEQAAKVQKAQAEAQKAQVSIQAAQNKAAQDAAASATKTQMLQQKMAHADDAHTASLDEQALAMVQQAQQQDEAHQLNAAQQQAKLKQSQEQHQARLKAMNKPKPQPAKPKR